MDLSDDQSKQRQSELISHLLAHFEIGNVTDVHVQVDGTVLYRNRGQLVLAKKWKNVTDESGKLLAPQTFTTFRDQLYGSERPSLESKVFRSKNYQLRVQSVPPMNGQSTQHSQRLVIRLQRSAPPLLTSILEAHPKTLDAILNASGLVAVCGGIGAGKTTTAASIAQFWASRRARHVATLEDPVEYVLNPSAQATHLEVTMPGEPEIPQMLTLKQGIRILRRSNIDALFIGEIRNGATRDECLDFAASKEAVVTTIHAGCYSDALLRLIQPSPNGMGMEALRLSVTQTLSYMLHVALAYTKEGAPVPLITCINAQSSHVRPTLTEMNTKTLSNQVTSALAHGSADEGFIPATKAIEAALRQGATLDSVKQALALAPEITGANFDWQRFDDAEGRSPRRLT